MIARFMSFYKPGVTARQGGVEFLHDGARQGRWRRGSGRRFGGKIGLWWVHRGQLKACGDSGRACALEAAAVIVAEQIMQEADRANSAA